MDTFFSNFNELMQSNQFLQGGMVLAIMSWIAYQLKSVPFMIYRKVKYYFVYTVNFDDSNDFYIYFSKWMLENYPAKFSNTEVTISYKEGSFSSKAYNYYLKFTQYEDSNLIWYKGTPIWVNKRRDQLENASDKRERVRNFYEISGFFCRKKIEQMCHDILQYRQKEILDDGQIGYRNSNWGWLDLRLPRSWKPFSKLFFKGKQELKDSLDLFCDSEELYKARGINYKKSYLLYGPAGTGKSSIGRAVADHVGKPLYYLNMNELKSGSELISLVSEIKDGAVVVMEDVDCIVNNRQVKSSGKESVDFGTLLNILDGSYSKDKTIYILTTNHIEQLDPALIRSGRINEMVYLGNSSSEDMLNYLANHYQTPVDKIEVEFSGDILPMSDIQEICLAHEELDDAVENILELEKEKNEQKSNSSAACA